MSLRAILAAVIALLSPWSIYAAIGAQIAKEAVNGVDVITLQGPIKSNDVAQFEAAANASSKALVGLNSGGGSLIAGLQMGGLINRKNFATVVPPDSMCASSCALMWLAGNPRIIEPGGVVGFHAAFFDEENGSKTISAQANALIGAFLNQLGFSADVIVHVTHAMPEQMAWLNESTARRLGIAVVWAEQGNEPSSQPPVPAGGLRKPYAPVSAVAVFYQALGAADGNTAAALVVPEKRGIGPFNENNMASFFGNMREPLRLLSNPRQLGSDLVRAEYRYVYKNGKECNGRADVTTRYEFGNTLIQGIKANC
jgi:hypothetical protein